MKLSLVATLAATLAPAFSFLQTSEYDSFQLNEQVLRRRDLAKIFIVRRGDQTQSGSSADQTVPTTTTGQQIPPLSLGSPRASQRRPRGPPRAPSSSGDSDSSADRIGTEASSKIKAKVTGPASVRWDHDMDGEKSRELAQGERFKHSVRGRQGVTMDVTTHEGSPPGKARLTAKGSRIARVDVDGRAGGSGKISQLSPPDPNQDIIPSGKHNVAILKGSRSRPGMPKLKAEIQGPGGISGEAFNRVAPPIGRGRFPIQ